MQQRHFESDFVRSVPGALGHETCCYGQPVFALDMNRNEQQQQYHHHQMHRSTAIHPSEIATRQRNVDVIVVGDSDEDFEEEEEVRRVSSMRNSSVFDQRFALPSSRYTDAAGSDSDDDCQLVGERFPLQQQDAPCSDERDEETADDWSEESDSSDFQVGGGPQSDIQRGWEEAALRRRMGRAMKSAVSKVNGEPETTADLRRTEGVRSDCLSESVATSAFQDSLNSTAESSEAMVEQYQ